MPVGAMSEVIELPGGFSIIALVDQRQILVADPRDAVLSLMQMSVALPANTTPEQMRARAQQLTSVTQSMGGCGRAPEVAAAQGAELVSNDQVLVRDLPPVLQQMLLPLNIGQATAPVGSTERLSVFILCGRDDPEPAGAPNASVIEERLRQERVNRRAQRYLRDLRRDAVIEYR
jgi:peptidyl-prolyl cis-trans isomerase SurA